MYLGWLKMLGLFEASIETYLPKSRPHSRRVDACGLIREHPAGAESRQPLVPG